MSLFIASLNSGSNGNCYYVGNHQEAVLIDAGISCRELEKRMKRLELKIEKVKAVFISHEHTDHISGLEVLSKKHQIPVYISIPTLQNSRLKLEPALINSFSGHAPIAIGKLHVTAFSKSHDAADPYSFVVSQKEINIGVFTDIGYPCDRVISHFKQCHAAFLEANYDEQMLEESGYPFHLKKRIRSERGHLSNDQSYELFRSHRPEFMSHLFLSHLSKNNNSPECALKLFRQTNTPTLIEVASRDRESAVYQIFEIAPTSRKATAAQQQMTLF
jgi:phosphoribosyl 1,2-cyclic phosphodiesterase